jgi:hypothetical protein
MNDSFIGMSAYLNIISGIALIVYWYAFAIFMPYAQITSTIAILVKNRNWVWINALGVFGALAGLLGQAGIYVYQQANASGFASIGYYIAIAGTTFLIGTMLWETILWPIIVKQDETLLEFQGPIYTSKTFLPFFIAAGLLYSVGYLFVGIGVIQNGIFPCLAGYLMAFGAPLFGLGAAFGKLQAIVRSVGVTLMSIGLIIIGISMI